MAEVGASIPFSTGLDGTAINGATEGAVSPLFEGRTSPRSPSARVFVFGWTQLQPGGGTTGVVPRIRRGTNTGAPLVGEGNNEVLPYPVAGQGSHFIAVVDEIANPAGMAYLMTLQQTAGVGGATTLQNSLLVLSL